MWLGDQWLCILQDGRFCTNASVTVTHLSTSIGSRSFIAQKASYCFIYTYLYIRSIDGMYLHCTHMHIHETFFRLLSNVFVNVCCRNQVVLIFNRTCYATCVSPNYVYQPVHNYLGISTVQYLTRLSTGQREVSDRHFTGIPSRLKGL